MPEPVYPPRACQTDHRVPWLVTYRPDAASLSGARPDGTWGSGLPREQVP